MTMLAGVTLWRAIRVALALLLMVWVLRQFRKPGRALGRVFLWAMNLSHSRMTDWGLSHVAVRPGDVILDIGCGGGRTVQKLTALAPGGLVCGIDYAEGSVRASQATNADAISAGRVRIQLGSVAALPFRDQTFDVVTAVETHYYWPDLPANTNEIFRVVKPGGLVAFIAETARDSDSNAVARATMSLLMRASLLSVPEHRDLLERAGFTDISTLRYPGKGWICVTGRRPGSRIH
jgi:ubiquinone/menaquinone biosynthesis C-methylase UbiE